MTEPRTLRSRRSCLAVPGSSPKMLEKAKGLPADQLFMDIEDAVAPLAKPDARKNIVAALNEMLDVQAENQRLAELAAASRQQRRRGNR